jgi:hypothetical protein
MNWKNALGIFGGLLIVLGAELMKISAWKEAMTPAFVGLLFGQIGGMIALVTGAIYTLKPGQQESSTTTTSTATKVLPAVLLLLALPVMGMSVTGCALFTKKPTPATVEQGYQQVKTAADVVNSAGKIVASAQQLEIQLAQNPAVIPRATHRAIQQGFSVTADKVTKGLQVLQDVTKTATERQAAIQSISDSVGHLIDTELASLAPETRAAIVAILGGATVVLKAALLLT